MVEQGRLALRLTVAPLEGTVYTRDSIPLQIIFENVGAQRLRLLRKFEPTPVFFSIRMVREDGTPIGIPGAGKIDFQEGTVEYLTLNAGELFGFLVDVARVAYRREDITPGEYRVSVTYHNQYGEDCFQGVLSSNTTQVTVEASR